jgi:tRNA pseudouridine(55) synthase
MLKMIYKPIGMTPYELTLKLKKMYPNIKKIAYVYRLDPMAHGEILILINQSCNLINNFIKMKTDKIYEYSILFGVRTDTLDILGNILDNNIKNYDLNLILNKKKELVGDYFQKFPIFSSKTINYKGKMVPLWKLSKNIKEINIPEKRIYVNNITYKNHKIYSKNEILSLIKSRLDLVTSKNFDVKNFKNQWSNIKDGNYLVIDFVSKVSTGTYIRELSYQLGKLCNYNSINLNIFRKNILLI